MSCFLIGSFYLTNRANLISIQVKLCFLCFSPRSRRVEMAATRNEKLSVQFPSSFRRFKKLFTTFIREATTWRRQLGSDNLKATTQKRQLGSDNLEATTRKRQLGSDNLEATTRKRQLKRIYIKCITGGGDKKLANNKSNKLLLSSYIITRHPPTHLSHCNRLSPSRNGSDNLEATTRKRQLGSDKFEATTQKR